MIRKSLRKSIVIIRHGVKINYISQDTYLRQQAADNCTQEGYVLNFLIKIMINKTFVPYVISDIFLHFSRFIAHVHFKLEMLFSQLFIEKKCMEQRLLSTFQTSRIIIFSVYFYTQFAVGPTLELFPKILYINTKANFPHFPSHQPTFSNDIIP